MKIMLLCGGRGRRMGKLTDQLPKPLIEIRGRPILEHKLDRCIEQGFTEFIFCLGYKADLIRKTAEKYKDRCSLEFSDAGEEASMLSRIHQASPLFDDSVLLTYGDTLADININDLQEKHQESDNEATLVLTPIENPFGLVDFTRSGKITSFREKPFLNYYIGYGVLNKSALHFIPPKILEMPDGSGLVTFFKILIALEKLGAYLHKGLQITFNTQEEMRLAEETLIQFYTAPQK